MPSCALTISVVHKKFAHDLFYEINVYIWKNAWTFQLSQSSIIRLRTELFQLFRHQKTAETHWLQHFECHKMTYVSSQEKPFVKLNQIKCWKCFFLEFFQAPLLLLLFICGLALQFTASSFRIYVKINLSLKRR